MLIVAEPHQREKRNAAVSANIVTDATSTPSLTRAGAAAMASDGTFSAMEFIRAFEHEHAPLVAPVHPLLEIRASGTLFEHEHQARRPLLSSVMCVGSTSNCVVEVE